MKRLFIAECLNLKTGQVELIYIKIAPQFNSWINVYSLIKHELNRKPDQYKILNLDHAKAKVFKDLKNTTVLR